MIMFGHLDIQLMIWLICTVLIVLVCLIQSMDVLTLLHVIMTPMQNLISLITLRVNTLQRVLTVTVTVYLMLMPMEFVTMTTYVQVMLQMHVRDVLTRLLQITILQPLLTMVRATRELVVQKAYQTHTFMETLKIHLSLIL